jgi:hypothetical protein
MGLLDKALGLVTDVPIVGDLISGAAGHWSAQELQKTGQRHDKAMFFEQAKHDKDMFGLESDFASAQAAKQYERQKGLLQESPRLQMEGLKSAGLNPILAATGGFKSPAGGSLPIPTARASSSAKGSGGGVPPGAKLQLGQYRLLTEQANATAKQADLSEAQAEKVRKETEFVGNKIDISEPIARAFEKLVQIADNWSKNDGEKTKMMERLINRTEESKADLKRLWDFILNTYGNAQKAFEEIRRNKGVINLPNIEVKK